MAQASKDLEDELEPLPQGKHMDMDIDRPPFTLTPSTWADYVKRNGLTHIQSVLQRNTPANYAHSHDQHVYAILLCSWLTYEGPLKHEPSVRQRKRAKERAREQAGQEGDANQILRCERV